MEANDFVKITRATFARCPSGSFGMKVGIGTIGKIANSPQRMGLIAVDILNYGICNIWVKNLTTITKKEYFTKVLQGDKHG